MAEQKLVKAKAKRSVISGQISRVKAFVDSNLKDATVAEIETRLESLEGYFESFEATQSLIEQLDAEECNNKDRAVIEELFFTLKPCLKEALHKIKNPSCSSDSAVKLGENSPATNVKLLPLSPPSFSGNYTQWPNFYETFLTVVHKNSALDNITRFHYLRAALSDNVLKQIDSIEMTAENYEVALKLLVERYDKKPIIVQEHIKKLFELKTVSKPTFNNLRELIDSVNAHTRALTSLGRPVAHWDDLLVHIVVSKLDFQTLEKWNDECSQQRLATLSELLRFLDKRCRILEGGASATKPTIKYQRLVAPQTSLAALSSTTSKDCSCCKKGSHLIYRCPQFVALQPNQRILTAKRLSLCTNCLKRGHSNSNCPSSSLCRSCSKRHHSLLHLSEASTSDANATDHQILPTASDLVVNTSNLSAAESFAGSVQMQFKRSRVLLATALGRVIDCRGQFVTCRILLDSGSQLNFISEEFANLLGLQRTKSFIPIGGIGETDTCSKFMMTISLYSHVSSFHAEVEVQALPKISQLIPDSCINTEEWPIPPGIQLADPTFKSPGKIDILLGAQLYCRLIQQGQIHMAPNLPSLQNSVFGWVFMGGFLPNATTKYACNMATTKPSVTALEKILQKFWEIDSHDTPVQTLSNENRICVKHFKENVKRLESGQFMVRLPFKSDPSQALGPSLEYCKRRFMSIEKKLLRDSNVEKQYNQFMDEYEQLGHMTEVANIPKHNCFLPHHYVLKPDSSTTKLRVVFDASAKTYSGKSLNDTLLTSPTIQSDLFSIIIKFRIHKYVYTADISKMYRQVLVDPRDRCYQMILWKNQNQDALKYFELNTVTYGVTTAPYLAIACLQHLAEEEAHRFPQASKILKHDIYVDDVMTGSNNLDKALSSQSELISLLKTGHFELRKFCANHPKLLERIPKEYRESFLSINENEFVKTLGLIWQPTSDTFHYDFEIPDHFVVNKRTVVSDLGKMFDPLGLLGPVITLGKVFIQQLWKDKGLLWDTALPETLSTKWTRFVNDISALSAFQVPRIVPTGQFVSNAELHSFCDSSELAYGACCYIRSIDEGGKITMRLLCAKSRVAPLKTISIPKLELCGALLMAELADRVQKTLMIKFTNIYYYTDSQIVLQWIRCASYNWTTFVANRVTKINDLTANGEWRHISSQSNPADLISRGLFCSDLVKSSLWLNGPEFLHSRNLEHRTVDCQSDIPMELMPEQRAQRTVLLVSTKADLMEGVKHKNSLFKLEKIFAYVYRFYRNCKHPKARIGGPLQPDELQLALEGLLRNAQKVYFGELNSEKLSENNQLKPLTPFIDVRNNLIRVGGRIINSDLPYNHKHPILLPKQHSLTKLLFVYFHVKNMHAGPQALLASIRQMYWPLSGRILARQTVNNCVRCFRCKPRCSPQIMGELPGDRVKPTRAFLTTGIDFCGPFNVFIRVRGKTPLKAYVCIFVCFSTKAVHMELVGDLTSDAFIGALRRFISRRGLCRTIYCDNATNFTGAQHELERLAGAFWSTHHQISLHEFCLKEKIQWKPIPPRSPHFGGLWEAAVKSAKYHLVRVVANASLTYEELNTVVVQIEGIMNSRPLTPLSSDPNDLEALTPGHFLIGQAINSFPEPDITDRNITSLSRFRRLQYMQQIFWQRWSAEYLHLLQQRYKWSNKNTNLKSGTLVVVQEDNLPPHKWLLGRVVKTFPGKDGVVRVAEVKTQFGVYKRATVRLFPLPIEGIYEQPEDVHGGRDVKAEGKQLFQNSKCAA